MTRTPHPAVLAALAALALLSLVPAGCGGRFELPTERPDNFVPTDQSYAMIDTWKGMTGVQDLRVTQGGLLLALFNQGGSGPPSVPRGDVRLYPYSLPEPISTDYFKPLLHLFNPMAITTGANPSSLFVLDQGDSCQAKRDVRLGTCIPDSIIDVPNGRPYRNQVFDYSATWRVREYGLRGGDTVSTFTDTAFAQPFGIAADNQGRVYVSGLVVVLDTNQIDQRIRTRKAVSRVYRYKRGQRYPGVLDVHMPGTSVWHRDTTWVVFDGTGASSVSDPRGIHWSPAGVGPLYIADRGNNQAKSVSSNEIGVGFTRVDGSVTGAAFNHPEGVAADPAGYFYVVDRENRRVLRFTTAGEYVQLVDEEPNRDGLPLLDPTAVAVDDTAAYIADRGRGQIIRYNRRP